MQGRVDRSLADIDAVLLVLAADEHDRRRRPLRGGARLRAGARRDRAQQGRPASSRPRSPRRSSAAAELGDFHALHPVSALTGDGVPALRDELASLLPEGPSYFPDGQLTDTPLELRLAELIREKALALTREELPHALAVEVEEIAAKRVTATVLVETQSQKQIVVGKGGSMIREIGTRSRPEIEHLLGHRVFLDLRVKVRAKWRRDEALLERLGL